MGSSGGETGFPKLPPLLLVRSCDPAEPPEDWQLNGVRLLDPRQWDMRMIYSMAG
jgi:hypothetical protein